ncbi:peptide MFS transporter [Clostridium sporogenes]|uniref:peptide MFS transporter n=1 Tax=Clostridium sporogenes TaxID=1509 RepID=UPI0013D1701A|nr:peptide MFS transporter [Clostridium sporogenes]EJP6471229.1 peptide MFS transporter [Clostridium botulinum]NFV12081.1 peptide MFS transporter [Clostridium sporogenes]
MSSNVKEKTHPKGFWLICFTILWERFSYYGLTSLVILYFTASVAQGGVGLSTGEATMLFAWFAGLVYLAPVIGGILGDRYLGQQKCIIIGSFLAVLGDLFLFFSSGSISSVYISLFILIAANGFFKANCANLVGDLYPKNASSTKDAAYNLFYSAVNVGAFFAPIITGLIADNWFAVKKGNEIISYGYKQVFLVCAIGMLIGAVAFTMLAPKYLGNIGKYPATKNMDGKKVENRPLTTQEKRRCTAMFIITVFVIVFWTGYFQSQNSFLIYSRDHVNRIIGGFEIPVAWLTSLNAILCVFLAPLIGSFWIKLSKTKKGDLTIPTKMGLGILLMGIGFFIMVLSVLSTGGTGEGAAKASLGWICLTYVFNTVGEICLSPIGLAMFNKLSPDKYKNFFMGIWYTSTFFSSLISGKLAAFTENMGFLSVFRLIYISMFIMAAILFFMRNKLHHMMTDEDLELKNSTNLNV